MLRLTVESINTDEGACLLGPEHVGGPWPQSDSASNGVFSTVGQADIFDPLGFRIAKGQVHSDPTIRISNEPVPMLRSDLGTVLRAPSAYG